MIQEPRLVLYQGLRATIGLGWMFWKIEIEDTASPEAGYYVPILSMLDRFIFHHFSASDRLAYAPSHPH